ncbi:MAG: hypothetical protein AAF533_24395 [Acidobacteriota bacterium]
MSRQGRSLPSWMVLLIVSCGWALPTKAQDLRVQLSGGDVELLWTGVGPFRVRRSEDPATVASSGDLLATLDARSFVDAGAAAGPPNLYFYDIGSDCVPTGVDLPDDLFEDTDCDGFDGSVTDAIFVAGDVGSDGFPGTWDRPLATIGEGLSRASATGRSVWVSKGLYPESLTLVSGVDVIGAYDWADGWARADDHVTMLEGGPIAVQADGVSDVWVDRIDVRAADAAAPGAPSLAAWLVSSTAVTFSHLTLQAGAGAEGATGMAGDDGTPGGPGSAGQPGCEDSSLLCESCDRPLAGTGGASDCFFPGGNGGRPGNGEGGGDAGSPGTGGTAAGTPGGGGSGSGGGCGVDGDGDDGGPGMDGMGGDLGSAGGAQGVFAGTGYRPANGDAGGFGWTGGSGGGGGGGGGGWNLCDSWGSAGGGGGGGGCGGGPGDGGGGGGSSTALWGHASEVVLRECVLRSGLGGRGGAGGAGGTGGDGGLGGEGGPYGGPDDQEDAGCGGAGGPGGRGGDGGAGGGGGGGPSIALVLTGGASVARTGVTLVPGTGGTGGTSDGNPGADGDSLAELP